MNEQNDLKFMPGALEHLIEKLNEGKLLIVAGAGLSMPCGFPGWQKLVLELMPAWLEKWDKKDDAELIRSMKRHLLHASGIWWDSIPSEQQRKIFFENVFNRNDLRPHENHDLLARLPIKGLLTTNYDPLFELASPDWATNLKTHLDKDLGLLFSSDKKFLLKLHGTWNNMDSIILTSKQYASLSLNNAYQALYQSIQPHYTLLFLGYGGQDPDLEQMHQKLNEVYQGNLPDRYILLNKPSAALKAKLTGYIIAEYDGEREGHAVITRLLHYLLDHSEPIKDKTISLRLTEDEVKKYWQQIVADGEFNSMPVIGQKARRSLDNLYIKLLVTASGDKTRISEKCHDPIGMSEGKSESLNRPLSPDTALQLFPRQAVLGPPGVGKTTLLHWMAFTLSRRGLGLARPESFLLKEALDPIPFYLPLTFLKDRTGDLLSCLIEYLDERFPNCCSVNMISQAVEQGRAILLLDGLDEISAEELSGIKRKIVGFLNNRKWTLNPMVITCREASWQREETSLTLNAVLKVAELDNTAIGEYLLNWFGAEKSQPALALKAKICNNARWRELAVNPFLLSLIAWLSTIEELPERRVELYHKCIDALLNEKHKPQEERSKSQFGPDHPQIKIQALTQLAFNMMKKNQRIIGRDELRQLVGQSLQLRDPLMDERPGRLIDEIHQGSAILRETSVERVYEFQHNTFREYLAARYLVQDPNGLPQIIDKYCEDNVWTETICLYAALQPNTTDLVNKLAKKQKVDLAIRVIPDAKQVDWDKLDKETLNWKIRRSAVERLVLPEPDRSRLEEITDILKGILQGRQHDPNANVRYSALIALEKVGTPEAKAILRHTHNIPLDALLENRFHTYPARGREFTINQPDMPANMVLVPGGSFKMGETKEKVAIKDFYMSIFPVTNGEYRRFIEAGGYQQKQFWSDQGWKTKENNGWKEPRYWNDPQFSHDWQPVIGVSWYEAEAYCKWLTKIINGNWRFRLPTEEEWEHAARGPDGNEYAFGDWNEDIPRWDSYFDYEKGLTYGTARVNTVFKDCVSSFGVFDLSGNVWEWTDNWYDQREKKYRVIRGGSWVDVVTGGFRCAGRGGFRPDDRGIGLGFRVVCSAQF